MKKMIFKCPNCSKITMSNYKNMADRVQCLCGFSMQIDKMSENRVAYNCNPKKFTAQFKERYDILQKERVLKETDDKKVKKRLAKEIEYMKECQFLGTYECQYNMRNE